MARLAILVFLCVGGILGQSGFVLTSADAERAESALTANPEDVTLRANLIRYYYRLSFQPMTEEALLERRRAHILWLARHHPDVRILGETECTIEKEGD